MKISKDTVSVLKNLASINVNLLIKEGNVLSTKSTANNVVADIQVAETFDKEFGIYDLGQFLGILSMFDDPDIEFEEKSATIKEGKTRNTYWAAEPSILVYPTKSIKFPDADIEFDLDHAQLTKAIRASGVLGCNNLSFQGDGETLWMIVSNPAVDTSNEFKVELGETDKTFKANLKIDNLKLLNMDYKVSISSKKISRFASADGKVTYYVALEATSEF